MTINPKDKTDIVLALRETAKGIEQSIGPGLALQLMQAVGTELLVLALKHGPLLDEITGADAPEDTKDARADHLEMLIRTEIAAIADTVARLHLNKVRESDIINERLMRVFDPAPAFNEAVNRAIEAKKAARVAVSEMTVPQKISFERFQVPTLMKALENAGRDNPPPTVHRMALTAEDVEALNKAGVKEGRPN